MRKLDPVRTFLVVFGILALSADHFAASSFGGTNPNKAFIDKINQAEKNPDDFQADPDNEVGAPPECSPYLIAQMRRAWTRSHGLAALDRLPYESGFFVGFKNINGKLYYNVRIIPTNHANNMEGKISPGGDRAFFHTHPPGNFKASLSDEDFKTANRHSIAIYAISAKGLYMYDPPAEAAGKSEGKAFGAGEVQLTQGFEWGNDCHTRKKMGLSAAPAWITKSMAPSQTVDPASPDQTQVPSSRGDTDPPAP